MEPNWLYSLLGINGLDLDNLVSSEWYNVLRELLHYLKVIIEEYLWGEQMQGEQMQTYPEAMCYPEDEQNIIYPGLHRMNSNYTLEYIVYRETYTPSEFPPMVVEQPFVYGEESGYIQVMIQLARALMGLIFPNLPSALRTAPLGRKASLIVSWTRIGHLIKDSPSIGSGFVALVWEWITYVMCLIAPYLLFISLTLLTIFMVCECQIFKRIASYEDVVEERIRGLPVDVLNLIVLIVSFVWWVICIPPRMVSWLICVVIRFAYDWIVEFGKDLVDYFYEVILFEC